MSIIPAIMMVSEGVFVAETEFGYIMLKDGNLVSYSKNLADILKMVSDEKLTVYGENLMDEVLKLKYSARKAAQEEVEKFEENKIDYLVKAGIFKSKEEAIQKIRELKIEAAEIKIKEESSRPDLHLSNTILALDEVDKFLNILSTRVREWYGLTFPELESILQDNVQYCKFVATVGKKENISSENLKDLNLPERKIDSILRVLESSKGGKVSDLDMERIASLAELALQLYKEREKLAERVDKLMDMIAPNIKSITGSTIGARLIAKAGSLEKLALLPSSTIQVLGAEKALFRALRTGTNPPKHGILFQHPEVHGAPKWQRGKIARAIANKVALAARLDFFGSGEAEGLAVSLQKRISAIKTIYSKPKQEGKNGKGKNTKKRK